MKIEGFEFKAVNHHYDDTSPSVFLYKHLASGMYYVFSRLYPRKTIKNYSLPLTVRQYVQQVPSEVLLFAHPVKDASILDLKQIVTKLNNSFHDKGLLINRKHTRSFNDTETLGIERVHKVWVAKDKTTEAKYIFHALGNIDDATVRASFDSRLITHNTHIMKKLRHVNRTMHEYTRKNYPLLTNQWTLEASGDVCSSEREAKTASIKLAKTIIEAGGVVLNRISDSDALYFRNEILKLPTLDMNAYLDL